jgi:hypothetical protein
MFTNSSMESYDIEACIVIECVYALYINMDHWLLRTVPDDDSNERQWEFALFELRYSPIGCMFRTAS